MLQVEAPLTVIKNHKYQRKLHSKSDEFSCDPTTEFQGFIQLSKTVSNRIKEKMEWSITQNY